MRNARKKDVMTPEQRRHCMSQIRSRDTKPEVVLRKALWALGLRYRIHHGLIGRPDIVFPGARVAVFVDGCFWHVCPKHGVKPKTNKEFWKEKLKKNRARDRRVNRSLGNDGWFVMRVWEHEIEESLQKTASNIRRVVQIRQSQS